MGSGPPVIDAKTAAAVSVFLAAVDRRFDRAGAGQVFAYGRCIGPGTGGAWMPSKV